MATVKSLGDGRWQVRVYLEVDGRPVRPSKVVIARNRSQAEAKANDWLREIKASGRTDFKRRTVSDAVDAWFEACELKGLSPGTIYGYRQHVDALKRDLGPRQLDKLTSQEVQAYYKRLRAQGLKVNHRHAALRGVLNEAMHLGWVPANVAKLARRPPERPKRSAPPTVTEVAHLLKVAADRSPTSLFMVTVAIGTGMRRGEIAALRASKVDLEGSALIVNSALSTVKDGSELVVKEPKTNQVRRVPLSPKVTDALLGQALVLEERAAASRVELVADPWLWSARADAGRPRHPDWFSKEFAACREAAGVTARLHDLRHAFATWALDAGLPLPTVSEILGHANPATTSSIYSHGVATSARRVADAIGSMIAGELEP